MTLAWLLLLTGLTLSAVAIYYSVVGLAAIFSAAVIPIIVMGSALEIAKLVCAAWLKENWFRVPRLLKIYMTTAVVVLMLITSMGIFGFLSKAHSDQSLVSGDVGAKIAVYDEQIKTERENIEANRKQLNQMDAAVDQVMARSTTEGGADKANNIRQRQLKDRQRIAQEITASQKKIASLQQERAPIAAEVRKVEAEVGPLKYIAAFVYGSTDETLLEKAVTWVIIIIIVVFDPLAVIMLLAAQMSFAWRKEQNGEPEINDFFDRARFWARKADNDKTNYKPDDGPLTDDQLKQIAKAVKSVTPDLAEEIEKLAEKKEEITHTEPVPSTPSTALGGDITAPEETVEGTSIDQWNKMIEEAEKAVEAEKNQPALVEKEFARGEELLTEEESKKKTYMIKNELGQTQIKNR
jgi:hypothetical protein